MLGNNPTQMDSYNKTTQGKGTLIANWFEQRVHRDAKGQGRAMTKTHIPKKHQQLMNSQSNGFSGQVYDDTKYRILGDKEYPTTKTQNYHYGKGYNKADSFPRTGRKQQLVEQMYLQQITQQINEKQQRKQQQARRGVFTTTNRETFIPKPLTENVIGRLNMYDQNGRPVDIENVDEDLRVTNGFKDKGQITPDQELKAMIDTGVGYEKQEPITFWREKLEDGTFYHSKPSGTQPFAKNNDFLKTFKHYKHYHD